jgi:hypothetical protein
MLLEIYNEVENKNPKSGVLSKALVMEDLAGEPPMIKALRKDRFNLFELLLTLNREKILKYDEVLLQQD